jgi:hypothetical protein
MILQRLTSSLIDADYPVFAWGEVMFFQAGLSLLGLLSDQVDPS